MKRSAFVSMFVMAMRDRVCDNEHNVWLRNEYGVGSRFVDASSSLQGHRITGRQRGSMDKSGYDETSIGVCRVFALIRNDVLGPES